MRDNLRNIQSHEFGIGSTSSVEFAVEARRVETESSGFAGSDKLLLLLCDIFSKIVQFW